MKYIEVDLDLVRISKQNNQEVIELLALDRIISRISLEDFAECIKVLVYELL